MTTISTAMRRLALLLAVLALTTSRCAAAFVQQAFVVPTVNYCDHRTTTSIRGIPRKARAWAHKKDGIEERLDKLQQQQPLDKAGTTHPLDGSVDDVSSPASTRGNNNNALFKTWTSLASFLAVVMSSSTGAAWAAGPDWGIFEGRTLSLLHPVAMAGLLFYMIYTGILGLQWRRQRTIGTEISEAKARLPDLNGAKSVSAAIAAAEKSAEETVDAALVAKLKAALPLEQELNELQQERKALVQANPRDKHFSQGALLAFLGTLFGIEGPLNTYARAGKLFPGPHLYAGAGAVALWALAAAAVPAMTKGNESARNLHIAANVGCLGLFVWQVVSGIPIVLKVLEKTSWP